MPWATCVKKCVMTMKLNSKICGCWMSSFHVGPVKALNPHMCPKLLLFQVCLKLVSHLSKCLLCFYCCQVTSVMSTLCNPTDGSAPGSPVPGILQARTLEWVAISFSNAWKWKVKVKSLSCTWLFTTPWTAAYQAPLSMGFSRQEYWSGVPWPSPMPAIGLP